MVTPHLVTFTVEEIEDGEVEALIRFFARTWTRPACPWGFDYPCVMLGLLLEGHSMAWGGESSYALVGRKSE